jgi:hypothetical protein
MPIVWRSQMKMVGTLPSLRSSRNPLVAFGFVVLVAYGAYLAAEAILANDLSTLAYAAMFFVGGAVVIAILNDWRRGLYILVGWILFEDFVRKFLGNNMAIYFAKDLLALILYLSFFRSRSARRTGAFRIPFRLSLLVFFWFVFLQVFNPASTSIFYGILGMKVYFLYVPLIYVGYALIQSEEDLQRFFSFTCVLIIIVAGLGLAQSIIGPTFLNPAHMQEDIRDLSNSYHVAPISGLAAYRPTSVFVSAGRFVDFLIVAWLISLGFGGYLLLRSRRGRTLAFTTIGVVAAASLMTASRGVFMWNSGIALIIAAGFLWGAPWRQREALRVFRAIQRAALFVGIGIVLLLSFFPEELGSRLEVYSATLMPNSPTSELVHRTQTYPLQQLGFAFDHPRWPYGYGTGTCTLGGQYVVRIMHAPPMRIAVESGFGNLIVELGIVGLILWIVLSFSIIMSAWKVAKKLRGTPWFPLAFAIFLFAFVLFLPMTYTSFSAYQDFVINSDLWLFLGILYRLLQFSPEVQAVR